MQDLSANEWLDADAEGMMINRVPDIFLLLYSRDQQAGSNKTYDRGVHHQDFQKTLTGDDSSMMLRVQDYLELFYLK